MPFELFLHSFLCFHRVRLCLTRFLCFRFLDKKRVFVAFSFGLLCLAVRLCRLVACLFGCFICSVRPYIVRLHPFVCPVCRYCFKQAYFGLIWVVWLFVAFRCSLYRVI